MCVIFFFFFCVNVARFLTTNTLPETSSDIQFWFFFGMFSVVRSTKTDSDCTEQREIFMLCDRVCCVGWIEEPEHSDNKCIKWVKQTEWENVWEEVKHDNRHHGLRYDQMENNFNHTKKKTYSNSIRAHSFYRIKFDWVCLSFDARTQEMYAFFGGTAIR